MIPWMETRKNNWDSIFGLEHGVSCQNWNGSWDVGGSNEGHDGDHGQTSVVQFPVSLCLHCGFVNTGEIDRREDDSRKVSSLGVVGTAGLRDDFGKEDQSNNLLLA